MEDGYLVYDSIVTSTWSSGTDLYCGSWSSDGYTITQKYYKAGDRLYKFIYFIGSFSDKDDWQWDEATHTYLNTASMKRESGYDPFDPKYLDWKTAEGAS